MNERGQLIVVEGYDGSGKSTLIESVRELLASRTFQLVGRKKEPELEDIARILEREDRRPDARVEMLLRIGVEVERLNLIERALSESDFVVCDRGLTSMVSWFDYTGVNRTPYEPLLSELRTYYRDAITVLTVADFDTCWERSSSRGEQSRKDRLGKEVNRRFFEQYLSNVRVEEAAGTEFLTINTTVDDVHTSASRVVVALAQPRHQPRSDL